MSGMEVIKRCREEFTAEGVPVPKVLMLTAIEDPRLREACFREKLVDHFMTKPLDLREFSQIIDQFHQA